jgi:hypothetical protein
MSEEAPVMGAEQRAEGPRDRLVRADAEATAESSEGEGRCNCGSHPSHGGAKGSGAIGRNAGGGEGAPAEGG